MFSVDCKKILRHWNSKVGLFRTKWAEPFLDHELLLILCWHHCSHCITAPSSRAFLSRLARSLPVALRGSPVASAAASSCRREIPASYFHFPGTQDKNSGVWCFGAQQKCRLGRVRPYFQTFVFWWLPPDLGPRSERRSAMACGPSSRSRSWRTSRWTWEPLRLGETWT